MAQSGFTPIQLYYSTTASAAPVAGNLAAGELAINTNDEKLYFKNSAGVVKLLASSAAAGGTFTTLTTTGNTTLGDASTDTVTVNGYMGVGGAASSVASVFARGTALTGTNQYGVYAAPTGTSAATTSVNGVTTAPATADVAFTATSVYGLRALNATKGAASTITNQHGIAIDDQTQGTNNYGITSQVSSGTNKWNIYASGTANNAFNGSVRIGSTAAPTVALDITGAMSATGNVTGNSFINQSGATGGGLALAATNGGVQSRISATTAGALNFYYHTGGSQPLGMTLDTAGNLGLGVTPSAWGAGLKVIQFGARSSAYDSGPNTFITNNQYNDGSNHRYIATAAASDYYQSAGAHIWRTAPSGTAGAAITFTQSLAVGLGTTLALEGATSAAGTGIAFPATQLASSNANTLDDYEEGTFTPTIVGDGTAGTTTYTSQAGNYTKVGRVVNFKLLVSWSGQTGTGSLVIGGLPFTAAAESMVTPASVRVSNLTYTAGASITAQVQVSGVTIYPMQQVNGAAVAAIPVDTSAVIEVAGFYHV